MAKDYIVTVTVVFSNAVNSDSREDAVRWVKENISQEYGLDITDEEITSVEEMD